MQSLPLLYITSFLSGLCGLLPPPGPEQDEMKHHTGVRGWDNRYPKIFQLPLAKQEVVPRADLEVCVHRETCEHMRVHTHTNTHTRTPTVGQIDRRTDEQTDMETQRGYVS